MTRVDVSTRLRSVSKVETALKIEVSSLVHPANIKMAWIIIVHYVWLHHSMWSDLSGSQSPWTDDPLKMSSAYRGSQ